MRWIFLMFVLLTSCEKEGSAEVIRPVKVIQVTESSTSENQVIFPGTLRALQRADLSFRVDGTVQERNIIVGQEVKKDQILIQLDPREYKIALTKAKGKVESTQAQLDFADRDYARMQSIYETDPGAISASYLDRKKENFNQLKSELIVAKSDLFKAADDLTYTSLKAPFDGVIAAIYVENHEQVRAKQTVVRLIDTAEREMEINIPEKYINVLVNNGASLRFRVHLDAFPKKIFSASVKEIGTESSSTTQTYPVTLTLNDVPNELSLLPGMTGRAILQEPRGNVPSQPTYKLPKSAVFTDNLKNTFVWVVDQKSQTVHKTAVKLEDNNLGDFAIVKNGLNTGDWVVTAGTSFLSEGQKVTSAAEHAVP